jgi:hypothetical protein
MKPYLHARISAKKFGGIPEDYIEIHDWFDSTKAHIPDARHRLVLHNAYGIFLCEQVFGEIVQMPNGTFKRAPYIPTLAACFDQAELSEEYAGNVKRRAVRLSAGTAVTIVD